ncbi:MAG TPA: two-component regulator propeller domain-containing protein, partial [Bryobacteraceae bacterium]|nr:two-component regulator propeller domain-containing protein [Bryobacteraceae bacterium]
MSWRLWCCSLPLLACALPAFAIDPSIPVSQYLHTSWTQEEGAALPAIQALAQTSDGYLWLGTATGLIRFDGVRFFHWQPKPGEALPDSNVVSLEPCSAGGLWIDTRKGIARLAGGRLFRYPAADSWLKGAAAAMAEDSSGRLWINGGVST